MARFLLKNKEVSAEPLHYTLCGLEDVYLLNGFKRHSTKYGEGVAIEKAEDLHQAIGLYLIKNRKVLGPKDVRFLRKNMKFTQDDLAKELGVTGQTIARYEKGATEIPTPVDQLFRFKYALHLLPEDDRLQVLDEIQQTLKESAGMDESFDRPVYFSASASGWNKLGVPKAHMIKATKELC